ncbi:MAG: tetratricopeptide repeat protein, partial [Deferribacteraceae bacterium]|nr:tetratricopeptide repeat protein [Deferribacteraceae bacterium]
MFRAFNIFLFCIALLTSTYSYAQEVLVRKDSFRTEIFLRISPQEIVSVARGAAPNTVVVTFKNNIAAPFSQKPDDNFVASMEGKGRTFTVTFKPEADFAVFNDAEGLKLIAARPKEREDVLMSYGVGSPMLRKDNTLFENPTIDNELKRAESLIESKRYTDAINIFNNILTNTRSSYYQQDAMLRIGELYMLIAKSNPEFYIEAARIFDDFMSTYPNSNRLDYARRQSALAKDSGSMQQEAIAAYQGIYNTSSDAGTKRNALERVAQLYSEVGQYDRAIEAYRTYLANFTTDNMRIRTAIGKLYLSRSDSANAYNLFIDMPTADIAKNLTPSEILTIANIFREEGQKANADALFDYLISKNDNSTEYVESLYNLARSQLQAKDYDNYSQTLLKASAALPGNEYALKALVEYAEQNYPTRNATAWKEFLEPLYKVEDIYDLRPRADMVQIKAMYKDNDTAKLVPMIDKYVASYSESPEVPFLQRIKEETLFEMAVKNQAEKNYPTALTLYNQILLEFPESQRIPTVVNSMDDIYYDQIMTLYNARRYDEVVNAVEKRFLENPPKIQPWLTLWEDAMYQYILTNVGVISPRAVRIRAREYLTELPRGRYVEDVKIMLLEAFNTPYNTAYANERYADVLALYEENKDWVDTWADQSFTAGVKVKATNALLKMGANDKALEMYKTITPMITQDYAMLGYALCQDPVYDINKLTPDNFTNAIESAQSCDDPMYPLSLIKKYTKDRKYALREQYN